MIKENKHLSFITNMVYLVYAYMVSVLQIKQMPTC